jgi:deoxyribonuclease-4
VGCHVPLAGSPSGLGYVDRVKGEALQVFAANPRAWRPPRATPAADETFAAQCAERKLPVFVHAPYLVNLASPTEATRTKSVEALQHSVERGTRLGARGVVLHAGAAVESGHRDLALGYLKELLLPLLDGLSPDGPDLLIEPAAGGGEPIAATMDGLTGLFDALGYHPRLGVCLDTCHAFAAGHDLARPGGVRTTLNALVRAVGRGRLKLVHANDSKDPLGSTRDRHETVGKGCIGSEPFAELFRHPATRGVPVIVETPGGVDGQRRDIKLLKSLRDR